jgi:hypothetical protein
MPLTLDVHLKLCLSGIKSECDNYYKSYQLTTVIHYSQLIPYPSHHYVFLIVSFYPNIIVDVRHV